MLTWNLYHCSVKLPFSLVRFKDTTISRFPQTRDHQHKSHDLTSYDCMGRRPFVSLLFNPLLLPKRLLMEYLSLHCFVLALNYYSCYDLQDGKVLVLLGGKNSTTYLYVRAFMTLRSNSNHSSTTSPDSHVSPIHLPLLRVNKLS
jgi:hypothetical protein